MTSWWERDDPSISLAAHAEVVAHALREQKCYRADCGAGAYPSGEDAFALCLLIEDLIERIAQGEAFVQAHPASGAAARKLALLQADFAATWPTYETALVLYEADPDHYHRAFVRWRWDRRRERRAAARLLTA